MLLTMSFTLFSLAQENASGTGWHSLAGSSAADRLIEVLIVSIPIAGFSFQDTEAKMRTFSWG